MPEHDWEQGVPIMELLAMCGPNHSREDPESSWSVVLRVPMKHDSLSIGAGRALLTRLMRDQAFKVCEALYDSLTFEEMVSGFKNVSMMCMLKLRKIMGVNAEGGLDRAWLDA